MAAQENRQPDFRKGILICGAYGLGNAGDEAILKAILREVYSVMPGADVTVLSRNPTETAAANGIHVLHMFDICGFWRVLGRTRLYINGGGNLIQDVTSRRSLWYYLFTLYAAKLRHCKVLMYGCGIGPVNHPQDVRLTRRILNGCVDAVTLREPDSLKELEAMGVRSPEIMLTADPALTLEKAPEEETESVLLRAGIPPQGNYICFALRKWPGFAEKAPLFGAAARYAYETYGLTPVFAAVEKNQDPGANRIAAQGLEGIPHYFLDDAGSSGTIIGALARMKAVVSMRLHALIFAAGQGIPLVGVVYDPKVSAFLRYIGQELFTGLDLLTEEQLKSMIDSAVAQAAHPETQAAAVIRLQKMERKNAEVIRQLLEL